ncbi:energy-coupling factor transporter transmembrane protein EcfT [Glycomyces sp. TRM65418]|uniref:energy-coupling factor transporter transmembrane component T family protein n=1 Tax=Glycomyces sp. TRM65418 TaxID=2867006 RepID=UPI001CE64942|nr:energy-coupling factor transporter transmembrane component T [Glycomyces sp. TRM65418]MCC3761641.1 energy-coupling factor transporter transmembrane protein EcfT [Glycomyces sp. TRM65418]QZD55735.1 energy-coupling factor transporter transmembrane protein EcfT [Glycomyces sp. TRM65418]
MLTLAPVCDADAPIARVNPVAKLFAAFAVSTTALVAADWLTQLLLLGALLATVPFAGIRIGALARRLYWLWLAAGTVVIVNAVFAAEQTGAVLVAIGPITISSGALLDGAEIGLRVCVAATAGVLGFATTDPTDLADALTQQLKAPPRFTIGALAALRLLPLLGAEWRQIAAARRARGLEGGWNPLRRARLFGSTMFTLLVGAIRRAGRLAAAMDARGFDSEIPRTHARRQRMRRADWAVIGAGVLVCAGAIATSAAYGTFTVFA